MNVAELNVATMADIRAALPMSGWRERERNRFRAEPVEGDPDELEALAGRNGYMGMRGFDGFVGSPSGLFFGNRLAQIQRQDKRTDHG